MDNQISTIKNWLGTGSINIFGLPMSGKDTQGIELAKDLGGKFLSSGIIIRAKEAETKESYSESGALIPTNIFYDWVLPYFDRADLSSFPLILSSIGRWKGEEKTVIATAENSGHPIKAAILLNISESDVERRFDAARTLGDRGDRKDDQDLDVFHTRLQEFREKTMPVLEYYRALGLLISINGDQSRDAVHSEIINKLSARASQT